MAILGARCSHGALGDLSTESNDRSDTPLATWLGLTVCDGTAELGGHLLVENETFGDADLLDLHFHATCDSTKRRASLCG